MLLELCSELHTRMPNFYNFFIVFGFVFPVFPSQVLYLDKLGYPFLSSYVVGTGTQDKSGAKRVRMKSFLLLFMGGKGGCVPYFLAE